MNVLSLCDGMSCGQIALTELGIKIDNYYASEIEKNAIKVTQDNFPNTVQLGDVTKITEEFLQTLPKIDLVIFGSPCRSLSKATAGRKKYNNGLEGISWLFHPCNDILQWIKKYNNSDVRFLVENVDSNKTNDINEMSNLLGVQPVMIDSNLFTAQDRKRNYWTNIPIAPLPTSCDIVLKDIMDN
ncbi:MAG: DNA cytosine methyltransferase, partial [Bacteroidales bacterium]|nr:DNA cytosine methyltransferase [Bacteroidales bacterium]